MFLTVVKINLRFPQDANFKTKSDCYHQVSVAQFSIFCTNLPLFTQLSVIYITAISMPFSKAFASSRNTFTLLMS